MEEYAVPTSVPRDPAFGILSIPPKPYPCTPEEKIVLERFQGYLRAYLYAKKWNELFDFIAKVSELETDGRMVPALLSTPLMKGQAGSELIFNLLAQRADEFVFESLLRYGMNPNPVDRSGRTPLHHAVENRSQYVEALLNGAANTEAIGPTGQSAFALALERYSSMPSPQTRASCQAFLSRGVPLSRLGAQWKGTGFNLANLVINEDLQGMDLKQSDMRGTDLRHSRLEGAQLADTWYSSKTRFPPGFAPVEAGMKKAYLLQGIDNTQEECTEEEIETRQNALRDRYTQSKDPRSFEPPWKTYDAHQYYRTIQIINAGGTATSALTHSFSSMLPGLLFDYPVESLAPFLNWMRKNVPATQRVIESELLALCTPEVKHSLRSLDVIAMALSMVDAHQVSSEREAEFVFLLGKLGILSQSFQKWRFESMHGDDIGNGIRTPSLIEQFGYEKFDRQETDAVKALDPARGRPPFSFVAWSKENEPAKRVRDQPLSGITYASTPIFDRCFVGISSPIDGTLLVRNSSTYFGRAHLPSTILRSHEGGEEWLRETLPKGLDFIAKNYTPVRVTHRSDREGIMRLGSNLLQAVNNFSTWKCNTILEQAWAKGLDGNPILIGGYKSPGFHTLIEFLTRKRIALEQAIRSGGKEVDVPYLAWCHPNLPPWNPYAVLAMTPERLLLLEKMGAKGDYAAISDEALQRTGIRKFFEAGFNNEAELVMLSSFS